MANNADLEAMYRQGETWQSRNSRLKGIITVILLGVAIAGWILAGIMAFTISQMFPLVKSEVVPLIVDKNTGYMETVTTLDQSREKVTQQQAVRAAFVGNYVLRREIYDPRYVADNYDMVGLWSDPNGSAFKAYEELMNPANPQGPIAMIGTDGEIRPEILSVNPLNANTMSVRFETKERVKGGTVVNRWSATIRYRQLQLPASNRVRLFNPLGFVVTDYVKVPESMPSGLGQ
ncbi:virB8 family protein [Phyllobacterium zundukense]|nr:type IV secretion system protein [Phyllobacterium zundukense]